MYIHIVGKVGLQKNNHEGDDVAAKSGDDEVDGFDCDDGWAKLNRGHEIALMDSSLLNLHSNGHLGWDYRSNY